MREVGAACILIIMPSLRAAVVTFVLLCAGLAHAGQGVALLRHVPEKVDFVAAVDVAKARTTPAFQQTMQVLQRLPVWRDMAAVSFDPARDLDTALVAGSVADSSGSRFVIVLEGRLSALETVLQRYPSRRLPGGPELREVEGGAVFWAERRLVLCSASMLDEVLATSRGKASSVRSARRAKSLRTAVRSIESRADGWMALDGAIFGNLEPLRFEWLSATVSGNRGVALEVRMGARSEGAAAEISTWMTDLIAASRLTVAAQGFESMADSFEVKATGTVVGVSGLMSEGEVSTALGLVSRFILGDAEQKSP